MFLILFSVFIFKDLLKNEQDQVPKEISQKYYISRVLGQGACGLVKLVYDKVIKKYNPTITYGVGLTEFTLFTV